jgi:glucose/mannose-6-phosphate isomerase
MTGSEPAQAPGAPVDLDRPETYPLVDRDGMLSHLERLPAQIEDAWALTHQLQAPTPYSAADAIVVAGMGGSAIGADLVRGLYAETLRVPLVVWRDYGLPAWVGPRTLVIASSYSGGTEETLSAVERAIARQAPVLGITTGGRLADVLAAHDLPCLRFTYPAQPRAAIGYSLVLVLGTLARLGYLAISDDAVGEGIAAVQASIASLGPAVPRADNPAKQLAGRLRDRIALIYGGGFLAVVARRWKGQCNENAKHWAFYEELPELNHNAVMGYQYPASATAAPHAVLLRSDLLPKRIQRRTAITAELLQRHGVPFTPMDAHGDGPLAHLLSTVAHGDWTSYYLALLNGIDPTGIAAIDYLKARLAEAD